MIRCWGTQDRVVPLLCSCNQYRRWKCHVAGMVQAAHELHHPNIEYPDTADLLQLLRCSCFHLWWLNLEWREGGWDIFLGHFQTLTLTLRKVSSLSGVQTTQVEGPLVEFGTVLVFSCLSSCWGEGGPREETVLVQGESMWTCGISEPPIKLESIAHIFASAEWNLGALRCGLHCRFSLSPLFSGQRPVKWGLSENLQCTNGQTLSDPRTP